MVRTTWWNTLLIVCDAQKGRQHFKEVCNLFVFFLDDEWKVNYCGSFSSIMKTKTKFIINQLIGWYTIEQKKDNTHDKQET